MSNPFEFSGIGSEEVEFERDTHALTLREVQQLMYAGALTDEARIVRVKALLATYDMAETPFDAYVHREDYDDDVKMLESERDEYKGQVDERDVAINTLEYDIKQLQDELREMEEERDNALRDAENQAEEVSSLRGQLEVSEEDATRAWNRVAELELEES